MSQRANKKSVGRNEEWPKFDATLNTKWQQQTINKISALANTVVGVK
jgi:hypothetical protein